MRAVRVVILALCIAVVAPVLLGSDAYFVRFSAIGKSAGCKFAAWGDNILLYNSGSSSATLRLLGVSGGGVPPMAVEIPAGRGASLEDLTRNARWVPTNWTPVYTLWVIHVDIPPGITAESRDEVLDYGQNCPAESRMNGATGKVSLPIFRSLVPAGVPQIKLGTDVGSTPARQNVAIYNAGASPATATIVLRRLCDDSVVESRTVSLPADSIVQFPSFTTGSSQTCGAQSTVVGSWVRYMVITVDQPSFSLVSSLTEAQPQSEGDIIPLVELATSINSVF